MLYIKTVTYENEIATNSFIAGLKKTFNIITQKNIFGKNAIAILPFEKSSNLKKLKKSINKIISIPRQNIVLSKELYKIEELKNKLYQKNANILDGKWLWNYLLEECITYISNQQEILLSEQEISILVNDNSETNLKNIVAISQKVKHLNIITNNSNYFKPIEEYLYNNLGIMITITNNKKKSLKRSNIIINIDFAEEEINQYNLPIKATILNISYPIKIYSKKFAGVNIIDYKIVLPKQYKENFEQYNFLEEFDHNILYESILYGNETYENIRKKVIENKTKIQFFVGKNGMIQKNEYKVLQ